MAFFVATLTNLFPMCCRGRKGSDRLTRQLEAKDINLGFFYYDYSGSPKFQKKLAGLWINGLEKGKAGR